VRPLTGWIFGADFYFGGRLRVPDATKHDEMLAPDGRLFLFASSNSFPTAYVKVSPDWIMDYFAIQRICRLQGLSYGIPASGR
jgi:hypothetical protein